MVAVVDRFGVIQVVLRDRYAGPHTPATASGKAWTAATFRNSTSNLFSISQPGMMQAGIRTLPGVAIIGGGLVVESAGTLVGAIGVSGAPGGNADEACAKAGIEFDPNQTGFLTVTRLELISGRQRLLPIDSTCRFDLGRALINTQPNADGCQLDESEVVGCEFVVASGDTPTLVDHVEERSTRLCARDIGNG